MADNPTYDNASVGEIVFMNKWYIQVPLHLILLEILVACVLRIVYAIVLINKYRHKREECYKPPILDDNYYGGAPNYASDPLPPNKKDEAQTAQLASNATTNPAKK